MKITLKATLALSLLILATACNNPSENSKREASQSSPSLFSWANANIYFLLTDRFHNGDSENDINFNRTKETAALRGFEGGDIKGIIQKIESGYFNKLGVDAIWFTPVVEQIHGVVDEGTGETYAYHGYWTKDWTAIDPNFGSMEELQELVAVAHQHDIKVIMDVVLNHTGPVTPKDPSWGNGWVRTDPACDFQSYTSTTACTLVENLPDIKTRSNQEVKLPELLTNKWKKEGRYKKEMAELDAFFERTGYPRAPRYYIIKWLTDFIRKFGIDAFRVDTVKHVEEEVWKELRKEADYAYQQYLQNHDTTASYIPEDEFFMFAEVYNYSIANGPAFSFGDSVVNYYEYGFDGLINFDFKSDASLSYDSVFTMYSDMVNDTYQDKVFINYISSHDDSQPFDLMRKMPKKAGTKLLLTPGAVQIYYGDEIARPLQYPDAVGDANLRTMMDWSALEQDSIQEIITHWQKLGQFRHDHISVGAGRHKQLNQDPYIFSRTYQENDQSDAVVVALDYLSEEKVINTANTFTDGTTLKDYYSGQEVEVKNGTVKLNSSYDIVLLAPI